MSDTCNHEPFYGPSGRRWPCPECAAIRDHEKNDRVAKLERENADLRAQLAEAQSVLQEHEIVIGLIAKALNVTDEPHQGYHARVLEAAEAAQRDAGRGDPMENWLMKPALEWLEQAEHGHDNERCKMIAAMLRDLWRGSSIVTTGDAAIVKEGK